ncbi:basement membrane-specific heparan sulfate proteoglycan core protein-like [Plakobranchus ocellatus]|uniref:Basement membrane-specific heparan sulfate proteoglycan core protein-like n=1 Tax=Plakobranchus ocellatus TaxID=259542 RepID=A0AAV4DLY5_9GAST|nr:basement membrane-specific heparan sulfate proteoglycan core protein-like [Plakobranchus ocellatus]
MRNIESYSPYGSTIGLNINGPLFLGGVDPSVKVNENTGVTVGFVGCIGELFIRDQEIRLAQSALTALNIQNCGDRSLCDRRPCRNGAECIDLSPTDYSCRCMDGFVGRNCEIVETICDRADPCRNGGKCYMDGNTQRCHCPLGRAGLYCEEEIILGNNVEFSGNGYVEFSTSVFPHSRSLRMETVTIKLSTTESDGLLFFQGQGPGLQSGKDYIAASIKGGFVEFSYELGSGPSSIKSTTQVNDGLPHTVTLTRYGRDGTVTVDNGKLSKGWSKGLLKVLNAAGNFFLGGVPDYKEYTDNVYDKSFNGCISSISINDRQITIKNDALSGMNVGNCN